MIDRNLNYGRHLIDKYLSRCGDYQSVLDIGAGKGSDLKLAKMNGNDARLYAIELRPENVRELKELDVEVFPINIERDKFPFPDGSIDIIIANQILEHTKELFWIFHEITRVLHVGGHVIIGVPNIAALHNRFLLALGWQPTPLKNYSAHVRGFTKRDLLRFLEECFPAGYKLTAFGGSNFYPLPAKLAKPMARMFPNLAWGIFFLLRKVGNYDHSFLEYPIVNKLETNFYTGQE